MASPRRRGSSWELRSWDGTKTRTRTFKGTEAEALKAGRAFDLEVGSADEGFDSTVEDCVQTFMLERHLSPTTTAEYQRAIAALPEAFAAKKLNRVGPRDLTKLYSRLRLDGVNVHTIRRVHEVLSAAFTCAVGWEWISRNPAAHASPPPRPRTERGAAAVADVKALLDVCPPKLKLWVRLAFVTGARRGEVCGLQWKDVALDRGVLVVRRNVVYTPASGLQVKETKTGKVHAVALDPETVRLLEEHWKMEFEVAGQLPADNHVMPGRWLFTHDLDGVDPWRPDYVTLTISRLQKKIGVHFPIHSIRHGTATELLDGGFALGVASERLGHDNQTTTARIYAHALPARDREAADYLASRLE